MFGSVRFEENVCSYLWYESVKQTQRSDLVSSVVLETVCCDMPIESWVVQVSAPAAFPRCLLSPHHSSVLQDFPVSQAIVWQQWRAGKMDNEQCCRDLVRCRDPRAPMALAAFEYLRKKQDMLNLQDEIDRTQEALRLRQNPFKQHPLIENWLRDYTPDNHGVKARFKVLALLGPSMEGKTSKAVSIFGISKTLKVSCQGCSPGVLPGLGSFKRGQHAAILFDECRSDQILLNREFFQSGVYPQSLSQSACNQYAYQLWVYQVAMIICANELKMSEADGISHSDAEWLRANVVVVTLPEGHSWFLKDNESFPTTSAGL